MNLLVAILILVLLAIVVLVVAAPLRARAADALGSAPEAGGERAQGRRGESSELAITRAELEAAREAKYREIRDSELDFRTGKLSAEDFAAIDGQLRGEAIAILDRLEALDPDADTNETPTAPRTAGSPQPPAHPEA